MNPPARALPKDTAGTLRRIVLLGLIAAGLLGTLSTAGHAAQDGSTRIILGGHSYGINGLPSAGFAQAVDSLASIGADAYVAGGDLTESGSPAEWDSLFALIDSSWTFPFYPVIGNHDAFNRNAWINRFGPTFYSSTIGGCIRLIVLDEVSRANDSFAPVQESWFLGQIGSALADTNITTILIAKHKLNWLKTDARYDEIVKLANGWSFEFSFAGYDTGPYKEELWPVIVSAGQQKPVIVFAGDVGTSAGVPALFYDELDGVTLIACGTDRTAMPDKDAFVILDVTGTTTTLQSFSPWGTALSPPESYDPAYWNAFFFSGPLFFPPPPAGPTDSDIIFVPGGSYEHGDHYVMSNNAYLPTTGYNVTYSDFYLDAREVTVKKYVAFLNNTGSNLYEGVECVDLDDPECQIEFTGSAYQAKDIAELDHPVIEVTWNGALAYCNYASTTSGLSPVYSGTAWNTSATGWRLPTEGEFEAAMRAGVGFTPGSTTYHRFPWAAVDEDSIHSYANYLGTDGRDTYEGLAPVGSFPPNPWGFYDMSGNAFEWMYDPWTWPWELTGAVNDPVAPGSSGMQDWRAVRGGGHNFHWLATRSAYRTGSIAVESQSYIGFRVGRNYAGVIGVGDDHSPTGLHLAPSYPNPSRGVGAVLNFALSASNQRVSLRIYDLQGRLVRDLFNGPVSAGGHKVRWDGRNSAGQLMGSGIYYAVLDVGGRQAQTRLTLLR